MGFKMKVDDEGGCISDDVTFDNALQLPDGSWAAPFVLIDEATYHAMAQDGAVNLFTCICSNCKAKQVASEPKSQESDGV